MPHNFKKQLGQNFLQGDRYVHKLVEALGNVKDQIVIEIGPGEGRVTNVLLHKNAQVVAVEVDYDLIPKLIGRFRDQDNFELIHGDILAISISDTLTKFGTEESKYKVCGSLPYNISKQVIVKFIREPNQPEIMAFIVQEEVAQDYVAQAPKASFLSNWIRLFAEIKKLETIPAQQFYPQPKVKGAILRIAPKKLSKSAKTNAEKLAELIRKSFTSPRKTLYNNLIALHPANLVKGMLAECSLSATARPAELTLENWQKVYTALAERLDV